MDKQEVTTSQLKQLGKRVRKEHDVILNNCGNICNTFQDKLLDRTTPPRVDTNSRGVGASKHVRIGENNEEKHYVNLIPTSLVEDLPQSEGYVYVELSLDQFSNCNKEAGEVDVSFGPKESIESVQIIPPGDSRRKRYGSAAEVFL